MAPIKNVLKGKLYEVKLKRNGEFLHMSGEGSTPVASQKWLSTFEQFKNHCKKNKLKMNDFILRETRLAHSLRVTSDKPLSNLALRTGG